MGIIFDLDLTIINSSIAETPRKNRVWSEVYKLIPKFTLYDGIIDAMTILLNNEIKICIVTSSPGSYCSKVLSHWHIPYDYTVCYHDTTNKKPHPEPIIKAVQHLKVAPSNILSLGDRDIDIIASNQANVPSVACLWGAEDTNTLINSKPKFTINSPSELIELATKFYPNFSASKSNLPF